MTVVTWTENVNPLDRLTTISFSRSGQQVTLTRGQAYDLTDAEIASLRSTIVLVPGGTPVTPANDPRRTITYVEAQALASNGAEMGYAEITTPYGNSSLAAVEGDVPGMSVSVVCDGVSPIEIAVNLAVLKLVNTGQFSAFVKEGSTYIVGRTSPTLANNQQDTLHLMRRLVPTAGAHTYKVALQPSTVGGQIFADTNYVGPSFISVVDR